MKKLDYKHTIIACFIGYISQAIIVNFPPLLFLTFNTSYGIELSKITLVITLIFIVQLITDLLASRYAHKLGTRKCLVLAHIMCAVGLVLLASLPELIDAYTGIIIASVIYAVGGGLLEVMVSPVVEACPTENKAGVMSILHSFYCWGVVGTVILCTVFFVLFGTARWQILSCLLALVPLCNMILFTKVPIFNIAEESNDKPCYKKLFSQKIFILMLFMMICSGASEVAVSQWVSAFAERGFNISKTMGDMIGACGFALFMGISRAIYGKLSERISIKLAMLISAFLCIVSYLMISLSDSALIGLSGCMLCGFSVGVFWPGTISLAADNVKFGGTTMFALLALGGDIGCSLGPTIVGVVSGINGDNLKLGILAATVVPVVFFAGLLFLKTKPRQM